MKKIDKSSVEQTMNIEDVIAFVEKEIKNINGDENLLVGAMVVETVNCVCLLIDGITSKRLYMEAASALLSLLGIITCKATFNQEQKVKYLKTVSEALKTGDKSKLEELQLGFLNLIGAEKGVTVGEVNRHFVKEINSHVRDARKELKMKRRLQKGNFGLLNISIKD